MPSLKDHTNSLPEKKPTLKFLPNPEKSQFPPLNTSQSHDHHFVLDLASACNDCFTGNTGETPERRGGAHMGFPERIDTTLN